MLQNISHNVVFDFNKVVDRIYIKKLEKCYGRSLYPMPVRQDT